MRRAALLPLAVAVSFMAGLLLAYLGNVVLLIVAERFDPLDGGAEVTFKIIYTLIIIAAVLLAVASGWRLTQSWRLPTFWTILLILLLLGAVSYPLALGSSYVNDCGVEVRFPLSLTHGCD